MSHSVVLHTTLGPDFIGLVVASTLYGVSIVQAWYYYGHQDDTWASNHWSAPSWALGFHHTNWGAQLDTLVRLAGSTSSAIGLSTTQKVTDSSPPNHNIAKEKAEKMPTITSTHEHESVSTSSDSSLKQKTRSGKFNLFGPLKKETGNNRAEAGRLKGSLFVENVDSS